MADERQVNLTVEQIRILRSITKPRSLAADAKALKDWSVDLDKRLWEALTPEERLRGGYVDTR